MLPILIIGAIRLAIVGGLAWLFILPSSIAFRRHRPHRWIILAVDVFLGGTVVGWLWALFWAMRAPKSVGQAGSALDVLVDYVSHVQVGSGRPDSGQPGSLSSAAESSSPGEAVRQLERLGQLKAAGVLDDAEFAALKAQIGVVLRNRPLALANLGYFGHMWELYAMWGWFLAFATASLPGLGLAGARAASLVTFAVVGSGIAGAIGGGLLADRIGRTAAAALLMAISGLCALIIGFAFDGPLWRFLVVAIVWGISVIGDSAQFSAMATELSDPRFVGTALTLQLGLGFALTVVSIRLTPVVAAALGWRWSFLLLVPGPIVGVLAMLALWTLPEARRIADGLR